MNRRTATVGLCLLLLAALGAPGTLSAKSPGTVEQQFRKTFPDAEYDAIRPSPIKGLYEVIKDSEVIYFAPDPGVLVVGDLFNAKGMNLTERRKGELFAAKAKKLLPLDKALKIGAGKHVIVEFTDPDCSFCRNASADLARRTDVTRYIFFYPLPVHKDAENKVKHIFCAEDPAGAYEAAMQGKLDDQKYPPCTRPKAEERLNLHKEAGRKLGIRGTPFFLIDWKTAVQGADVERIEAALQE